MPRPRYVEALLLPFVGMNKSRKLVIQLNRFNHFSMQIKHQDLETNQVYICNYLETNDVDLLRCCFIISNQYLMIHSEFHCSGHLKPPGILIAELSLSLIHI